MACFSRNQAAPERLRWAGVRRSTWPKILASPTVFMLSADAKSTKRMAAWAREIVVKKRIGARIASGQTGRRHECISWACSPSNEMKTSPGPANSSIDKYQQQADVGVGCGPGVRPTSEYEAEAAADGARVLCKKDALAGV